MNPIALGSSAFPTKSPFAKLSVPEHRAEVASLKAADASIGFLLRRTADRAKKLGLGAEVIASNPETTKETLAIIKNLSALVTLATETGAATSDLLGTDKYKPFKSYLSKIVTEVGAFVAQLQDQLPLSPIVRALGKTNEDLLVYIADNGQSTMTALSKALGCSTAAMTGQVDRLEKFPILGDEKIQLVERRENPGDRRENRIALTQNGEIVVEETRLVRSMRALLGEITKAIKSGSIDSELV